MNVRRYVRSALPMNSVYVDVPGQAALSLKRLLILPAQSKTDADPPGQAHRQVIFHRMGVSCDQGLIARLRA